MDAGEASSPEVGRTVPVPPGCTTPVLVDEETYLNRTIDPCKPLPMCREDHLYFAVDDTGMVEDVRGGGITPLARKCVLKALRSTCFPKAAGTEIDVFFFGPCD